MVKTIRRRSVSIHEESKKSKKIWFVFVCCRLIQRRTCQYGWEDKQKMIIDLIILFRITHYYSGRMVISRLGTRLGKIKNGQLWLSVENTTPMLSVCECIYVLLHKKNWMNVSAWQTFLFSYSPLERSHTINQSTAYHNKTILWKTVIMVSVDRSMVFFYCWYNTFFFETKLLI